MSTIGTKTCSVNNGFTTDYNQGAGRMIERGQGFTPTDKEGGDNNMVTIAISPLVGVKINWEGKTDRERDDTGTIKICPLVGVQINWEVKTVSYL